MKITKKICMLAGAVLVCGMLICGCGSPKEPVPTTLVTVPEVTEPKQPSQYTLEEYLAMTAQEQLEFQKSFGSTEVFDAWMENAMREVTLVECPWAEPGAKHPADYTWEEFDALSGEQQIVFQNVMGEEAFDAWLVQAQSKPQANPWDEPGAKQPEEYTWEEFEALSGGEQIGFQNLLGEDGFEAWMEQFQSQSEEYPWEESGAKQPADYTWEEFEALSGEHQIVFQNVLGMEAFEAWLNRVCP